MEYRLSHCRHLAVLVLLCLLYGNSIAKQNRWECLPTTDGKSWQCGEAGSPQRKPILPLQKTTPALKATPAAVPPPRKAEEQGGQQGGATEKPAIAPAAREPAGQSAPMPKAIDSAVTRKQPGETAASPYQTPPAKENTPAAAAPDTYARLLDQGMEWDRCQHLPTPPPEKPADKRIVIEADAATALPEEDSATFRGNVVIRQPNQTLYADDLYYDHQRQLIKVDEQLLIQLRDLRLLGSQAWFDLNKHQGEMAQISYRIPSRKARGTASKMVLLNENHSRYENISYTTCPPGNKGFVLSANSMEIDQKQQIGTFRAAKLHFLGVPIFYAPKLTIPLDGARKSGVLVPSLGYSSRNGADMSIPYYFNLAPNYDATLTPRLLGRRGLVLGGEFRFLTPPHRGELRAEILPDDRLYDSQGGRGALRARSRSNLAFITPGLTADLDLNWVSDRDYLDDLGQSLTVTSTRHLRSRAALGWRNRDWDALAELRHYKTLDRNILPQDRPYSLLPRVAFDWRKHQGPAGLD
ncbi:LPS assembly protein LptD, partial [Thiolapillus sp.]